MAERRRVRIFISSPSDVRPERLIAARVVERLGREFGGHMLVEPMLWEREPLLATQHFQDLITPPHETDIVVVILWSRLGVPLPEDKYRGAVSGKTVTGTEWEFEDALQSYRLRQAPDLLVYRKRAEILASLDDENAYEQLRTNKRLVDDFMKRWFEDPTLGSFTAAFRDFSAAAEFEDLLEQHLRELLRKRLDLPEGEVVAAAIRWHKGSPFRGLASFDVEHAPIFFGRTRAKNELRELLVRRAGRGSAFVLVIGASGSGKSSVVKAGLLPDLLLPGMVEQVALCRYAVVRPADNPDEPLAALAEAMLGPTALPELGALQYDAATLKSLLTGTPTQTALPIRQGLAKAGAAAQLTAIAEARLIVIVDQLEELFTIEGLPAERREAFVAALETLAQCGLVWVIATMRSDFFDRLAAFPRLAALSAEARYLLTPPDGAEIGQIIRQPAREAGLRFERDEAKGVTLDEVIMQASTRDPGALPLLEFLLDQLWQRRRDNGVLTFGAYQELGGFEGALGHRAEEEFSRLPAAVQAAVPSVLRALVTVGHEETAVPTARAVPMTSFPEDSAARQAVDAFLAPSARLLVAEGDGSGAHVRVAHEALITHWQRAREQILTDRADLQVRARLEQAAARWRATVGAKKVKKRERDSLLLQRGLPLGEAQALVQRRGLELGRDLTEFVAISTRTARRLERRRIRRLIGLIVLFGALAVMGISSAIFADQESRKASANFNVAVGAIDVMVTEVAVRMRDLVGVPADRVKAILEKAEDVLERIAATTTLKSESVDIRYRRAYMYLAFAETYSDLGDVEGRLRTARAARDIVSRLLEEHPERRIWNRTLLISHHRIGHALYDKGDVEGARQEYRTAAVIARRLVDETPDEPDFLLDLASSLGFVGDLEQNEGRPERAIALYREAIGYGERSVALDPKNQNARGSVGGLHGRIGWILEGQGDLDGALKEYRADFEYQKRLVDEEGTLASNKAGLAGTYGRLGNIYKR